MAIVTLNYHRRHSANCTGKHPATTYTSEPEERKKGWARCKCPITASGSLGGKARRIATKQIDWHEAAAVMAPYIAANSWDLPTPTLPCGPRELPAPTRDDLGTLEPTITQYLAVKSGRGVTGSTMKKYRTFTNQLAAFCTTRGIVRITDIRTADLDIFYASWKDGKNSKGKKLERMKGFFNFCLKRKLTAENPAEPLEAPINYGRVNQKAPFTESELERIFEAAAGWQTCDWHNGVTKRSGRITADLVVTFVMLLTETGLRISDAATFNVTDRVNADTHECFLMMHKTQKPLFIWINPDLYGRLSTLAQELGPTPFITESTDPSQAGDAWRERLAKVFEWAGPFPTHPVPHRFRHTFVRIQLERGVSVEEVAELIGDTPEMVRQHYAQWIPERQARLTATLQAAYEASRKSKWRGHVVPITGKKPVKAG
jgi:site-specific recombinase XerD